MTAIVEAWPFNQAGVPADCQDFDEAVWYAVRSWGNGELPVQSLRRWCLEQRARRSRDAIGPTPIDHERLHDDLLAALAAVSATEASR